MSAATLDFEDVRVLEEKETFELINANEASTTPKQPPKMLTAGTRDGVVTMNNIDVPSNNLTLPIWWLKKSTEWYITTMLRKSRLLQRSPPTKLLPHTQCSRLAELSEWVA